MINKDPERFTLFIAALTSWLNARRQQSFTPEQVAAGLKDCRGFAERADSSQRRKAPEGVQP